MPDQRSSRVTTRSRPRRIERSRDRRDQHAIGILSLGMGALHRAQQAWHTDLAIEAGDEGWGTFGVSLRSGASASKLKPQDCLYSLTAADSDTSSTRIIGAVRKVVATTSQGGRASAIAGAATRIVSLRVTGNSEKRKIEKT